MLEDVDGTLRAVLAEALPKDVVLTFATPDQDWRSKLGPAPAVNAFLAGLREDIGARSADWTTSYDEAHRVIGRREPVRRYRLHYVLTAWAAEAEREHALLGTVLRALVPWATVPARHLCGSLSGFADEVTLDVAHPDLPVFPVQGWSAFGLAPKACLDAVLGVPLMPAPERELARRPDTVELNVGRERSAPEPGRLPPRPARRIIEGG
jgi:hypothetical protein